MTLREQVPDTIPCRHELSPEDVSKTRSLLESLAAESPELLTGQDLDPAKWDVLLRAAVEQIRGANAATTTHKKRFIEEVLSHGVKLGVFEGFGFVGTENRQDYRVDLPDGTAVCIEAKGCPDGNNMNIWERPSWANEFIVWSLCPDSLVKQPGEGIWSGVAVRLLPNAASGHGQVDALVFFDGRCGSAGRPCPKKYGIHGELREIATDIPGQDGKRWLPPPCIYLFPRSEPHVRSNPTPPIHTVKSCKFADAMLALFNVPEDVRPSYVHEAHISMKGSEGGTTQILPTVVSRCWPDGESKTVEGNWKALRRE